MIWRDADGAKSSHVVRWAMARFAAWNAVVLIVLVLGVLLVSRQVARDVVSAEARERARLTAPIVTRLVTDELRRREPGAEAPLEAAFARQLGAGDLSHVRLWGTDGELLWADDEELIGRRFELPADVQQLFGTERVLTQVSPVDHTSQPHERQESLLEVYSGGYDADGRPVVYEAYLPPGTLRDLERAILTWVLPIAIGGVVLLQVAVLPLALVLARRMQRSEAARTRLTRHALQASELERRRIARDLHDGVVQELAGIGFALPVVAAELPDTPAGREARLLLGRLERGVQEGIASLRNVMVEVHPPDLERSGLESAVRTLVARSGNQRTSVEVGDLRDLDVPVDVARLVYRVVREGVHNVVKHAGAANACVHLRRVDDDVVVEVSDDGPGPGDPARRPAGGEGHLGLLLLQEAVTDAGGVLSLTARPEGGALLRAVIPLRHPAFDLA